MKTSKIVIFSLLTFILLFSFQNCTQINSTDLSQASGNQNSLTDGNGGAYEGKPKRYYRFNADFTCENSPSPIGMLSLGGNNILQFNTQNQCGSSSEIVVPANVDVSPLQDSVVGYREGIYEFFETAPAVVPSRIVEFWCKDSSQSSTPEVIVRYNTVDQNTYVQVFYPNGQIPEFTVTQTQGAGGKESLVNDSVGFRMFVNYDLPVMTLPGQIDANIEVFLPNQYLQKVLYCRTGGRFDALK